MLPVPKVLARQLMKTNYGTVYNSTIGLILATVLFFVRELQILSVLSFHDTGQQPFLSTLRDFFEVIAVFIAKFPIETGQYNQELCISIVFFVCQTILCLFNLIPWSRKEANEIISKFISIFSIVLPIPVTLHLAEKILIFKTDPKFLLTFSLLFVSFVLMMGNQYIYVNFHYAFSIKLCKKNVLSRFPGNPGK